MPLARLAVVACVLLVPIPSALAAPGWIDGNARYTYAPNCASIIFGSPYIEAEAASYASFYADPNNLPDAGEVFYIRTVAAGIGNPCGGAYANFELALHPELRYAISQDFPVFCFAYNANNPNAGWQRETATCPQSPGPLGRFGNGFNPRNSQTPAWPLPQGGFWQVQIPVYSKKKLLGASGTALFCDDCFFAPTQIIDGNGSPYTDAWQWLNVDQAEPAAGFPDPYVTFPAPNKAETTAYEFNYFEPGNVAAIVTDDDNESGEYESPENFAVTDSVSVTNNDYAIEMRHIWSSLRPNQQHLYELGIELARDGLFYATEPRIFTTPNWPSAGTIPGLESGGGTPTSTPPSSGQTALPPTQPDAPADPFSAIDENALKSGASSNRTIAKLSPARKAKRKRLLKKKALTVPFECAAACSIKGSLLLGKGKKKGKIAAGKAKLDKAGKGKLKLKLTKKGRKRLKKVKKGPLELSAATQVEGYPLFESLQAFKLVK